MSDLQRKLVGKGVQSGLPPRPLMGRVGGVGRGGKAMVRRSTHPFHGKNTGMIKNLSKLTKVNFVCIARALEQVPCFAFFMVEATVH